MEMNQINRALHTLSNFVPKAPQELVEKMVRSVNSLNKQRSLDEPTKAPDRAADNALSTAKSAPSPRRLR